MVTENGAIMHKRKQVICGRCVHYVICSKRSVKNVYKDTDRCAWMSDHYKEDK